MSILNAYYFRQHSYTIVPRHLREDMEWIAETGSDAITLSVIEQDLFATKYNLEHICREADRAGLKVFAVPGRWGGIVAGSPKVPSLFSAQHPETWARNADGSPVTTPYSGVISSIHHPSTREFVRATLSEMLAEFPITGIVWDEPKVLFTDHSQAARDALGSDADWGAHLDAIATFFDEMAGWATSVKDGVTNHMFLYADLGEQTIEKMAGIHHLDSFGCDGRPWYAEDGGRSDSHDGPSAKNLLPAAGRFMQAAADNGKDGLILVENHALTDADVDIMDRRLGEVLDRGPGHLIYYYYPRDVEDPDRAMEVIRRHVRAWKGG
jgi:hypothetical protein